MKNIELKNFKFFSENHNKLFFDFVDSNISGNRNNWNGSRLSTDTNTEELSLSSSSSDSRKVAKSENYISFFCSLIQNQKITKTLKTTLYKELVNNDLKRFTLYIEGNNLESDKEIILKINGIFQNLEKDKK